MARPQQVRGLFERDPAGKLLELVAADDEEGVLAVQVAQSSLDGDDSIEAARRGGGVGHDPFTTACGVTVHSVTTIRPTIPGWKEQWYGKAPGV